MTRERIRKLLPVLTKWVGGGTLQWKWKGELQWQDYREDDRVMANHITINLDNPGLMLRVKPEVEP